MDYLIQSGRLDNAEEFISNFFDDNCMSLRVDVEHLVPHIHTQNGLTQTLIMRTCVGLCNLTCSHVGPIEAHCYPTLFRVVAGDWV